MPYTIAIPTIGRIEMLPSCLFSLSLQEDPPDEIILLDEADAPVTGHYQVAQMLDLLSLSGVNVKVLRSRRRKGIGHARLRLAQESRNKHLLMVDDDVCLRPDYVLHLRSALGTFPESRWAVGTCFLVNKALPVDAYHDELISREDPRIVEWTSKYPWMLPYYRYVEEFEQLIPTSGTQAILFRDCGALVEKCADVEKLGSLAREDTYLTVKMGPGVFTSRTMNMHFEDHSQVGRLNWGNSMFYRLFEAVGKSPDQFIDMMDGNVDWDGVLQAQKKGIL